MAGNKKETFLRKMANKLPFLKDEEPEWDDGLGGDGDEEKNSASFLVYAIMAFYGFVTGFFGSQYCKYLSQRFAYQAWGYEMTRRHINVYGIPNVLSDIIAVAVVYFLLGIIGVLLNRALLLVFMKDAPNMSEIATQALMCALLVAVVVSIIMVILPFNIFYIIYHIPA